MDQELKSRLASVFNRVFSKPINLNETLSAKDVPGWDSLRHVLLLMEVEREFDLRFSAAEITYLKNVGELAELLQHKLGIPS
jgi:acyl carrier protein